MIDNHETHIDYLIIGQGIAGSLLALHLLKNNQTVKIVDSYKRGIAERTFQKISSKDILQKPATKTIVHAAGNHIFKLKNSLNISILGTRIPGGLISPITGKRLQKTWLTDTLLPYAWKFYRDLEETLQTNFFKETPIVRIFADALQANEWSVRSVSTDLRPYIYEDFVFENEAVNTPFGYTVFKRGAVIDGSKLLGKLRDYFKTRDQFIKDNFHFNDLQLDNKSVRWKNIKAQAIIFCEGWKALENPLFNWLPFKPSKGELLIIKSPDLKLKNLINRGIFIRPLVDDYYLVGSTYSWDNLTLEPTDEARIELCDKLKSLINKPFKVVDQIIGIRPTVYNRRPFLGQHPQYKNVHIFNGLGTKGLLLAPYFSSHMSQFLQDKVQLLEDVNIQRLEKKYFMKN